MIHGKRKHEGFVKSFRRVCTKLVYPQLSQGFRRQTGYMWCQFGRQINRCRAVNTADNADSSCLRFRLLFICFPKYVCLPSRTSTVSPKSSTCPFGRVSVSAEAEKVSKAAMPSAAHIVFIVTSFLLYFFNYSRNERLLFYYFTFLYCVFCNEMSGWAKQKILYRNPITEDLQMIPD